MSRTSIGAAVSAATDKGHVTASTGPGNTNPPELGPTPTRRSLTSRFASISTFDSLRVRDYRLLWLGQASTSMGQWMDQVARGYLIYTLTGSALQLGLATAIRGLPTLLFGMVAGALADRSGRKAQLIVAQSTNAVLNLILAALILTGNVQPWHIYLTGFLAGTVQAFQQPARQTLIGDIVGPKYLLNALALNSAVTNGSRTIGPAVAGIMIALVGNGWSYVIQALLFVFATVWTVQLHVPERDPGDGRVREPFVKSIGSGIKYVSKEPNIRVMILLALAPITLGQPYTSLMPIFAIDVLHGGAALQGLILTFIGIGSLGGAIVVASLRRERAYGLPVVVGAAAFGLALMGFAMSRWIAVSLGIGVIIGIFSITYRTQNQTMLQTLAPPHVRGRVLSLYQLDRGLVPLVTIGVTAMAAAFGAPTALLIMGSASVLVVGLVVLSRPQFLKLSVPLTQSEDDHDKGRRHARGLQPAEAESPA